MILSVASGKGGTGKTTVAVNLAVCAPEPVVLLDCDVEEPNCHLFLGAPLETIEQVGIGVPSLDEEACIGCGDCAAICQFQAVAELGGKPMLFPDLCHGCGGCMLACPTGAISEQQSEIGVIERARTGGCTLLHGRLKVGKALSPPLIKAVRRCGGAGGLTIVDGPPGTTCSLAAALSGCDLALLVAEPTPFGVHDLGLLLEGVEQLGLPRAVVVNRAGHRTNLVRELCDSAGVPVLAEIPESREVARAQARGQMASRRIPEIAAIFESMWPAIMGAAREQNPERDGLNPRS
ncbi:MAG: ATP-binding protein [Myxococcota bacterium]